MRLLYCGRPAEAARELETVFVTWPLPQPHFLLRQLQYAYIQAGEVYYWLNDMERLRIHAHHAAEVAQELQSELTLTLAAQLLDLHNLANPTATDRTYERPRLPNRHAAGTITYNTNYEILYQVRSGQTDHLATLIDLLKITPETDPQAIPPDRLTMYALARVALKQDLAGMDGLMAHGLERLERGGFRHFLGRLQAIEAWRQVRLGHFEAAVAALAAAVEIADQTGLIRAILDLPALSPFLGEVKHPRVGLLAAYMNTHTASPYSLTPGELSILDMLGRNLSYEEIAGKINVSVNTVRFHIKNIYSKLGVRRRQAAVQVAEEAGLI